MRVHFSAKPPKDLSILNLPLPPVNKSLPFSSNINLALLLLVS